MYRNLLGILAVFCVAVLLVGFTFSSTVEKRADFAFNNGSEPKTLDPQKMTGQIEGRIADALFEGLTYNDAATLEPKPGSAESWTTSPDGRVWTFKMRPTAKWSNGDPVTAHDFVFAWKRLQEPKLASEYAFLLHMIRHAEAYNTYGGHVEALGKILAAFPALLSENPQGMSATAWQKFVDGKSVRDAVIRTNDARILDALAKTEGSFTAEEGTTLKAAFEAEKTRRETALAEAKAHFGIDQGIFAPDDGTFVVELNSYMPYFFDLTAFYVTAPVHPPTVKRWPEDWFLPEKIVSNGPFLLERWSVNQKIRMRKNPGYWEADKVSLETVDAYPFDNRTTAFNLYMTGAIDWLPSSYPVDLVDVLKSRPDFEANPGMVVYFYRINCTRPPFTDPRVRRAIGLAFDREMIVKEITRKGEVPTTTLVAPGVPGYVSPGTALGYDPETARKLLAEAGFPGGKGFPEFSIIFNTDEGHRKIAEYIAGELKKNLGLEVSPKNEEWQSVLERARRIDYDMERAGWIGDYRDPNTFLDMWLTKGGQNQTGWGDPLYDRLIALAANVQNLVDMAEGERTKLFSRFKERSKAEENLRVLVDAKDEAAKRLAAADLRFQLFREAEAILFQDAFPVIPVYFYVVTSMVSPRVEGFYSWVNEGGKKIPNWQDIHPFREVRMRPAGKPTAAPPAPAEGSR